MKAWDFFNKLSDPSMPQSDLPTCPQQELGGHSLELM